MNSLPTLSKRKRFSKNAVKSTEVACPSKVNPIGSLIQRRSMIRKPLSLPLTHVLVNRDETYDIKKEYEFDLLLGFGTYAQVKSARNLQTGKEVAVKICRGTTSINMLKDEHNFLSGFDGNYFPKVIDFKVDKLWNRAYLIMEKVEGLPLDQYLKENQLDSDCIEGFMKQLGTMIKYLHKRNVCHRDIKPQNIIVTKSKELRLLDFNISKFFKSSDSQNFETVFLTQMSTPLYAAPEVYRGKGYDQSIDIWGIGIIGYLLCGGTISEDQSRVTDVYYTRHKHFQKIIEESDLLSDTLRAFINSCLQLNPDERPKIGDSQFESLTLEVIESAAENTYEEFKEIKEEE